MRDQRSREQRKHPRTPVSCTVSCRINSGNPSEEGESIALGGAKDVSLGGMFLECEQPPAFGTAITLQIDEGTRTALSLPAIVRWSTDSGFGVQFGLLGARDTHAVLALIKKTAT